MTKVDRPATPIGWSDTDWLAFQEVQTRALQIAIVNMEPVCYLGRWK